jgi:hypothetical protein
VGDENTHATMPKQSIGSGTTSKTLTECVRKRAYNDKFDDDLSELMSTSFTQMLSWADQNSGGIEMRAQVISTNQRAIDFYATFGFKVTDVISLRAENSHNGLTSLHDCSQEDSNSEVTKLIMTRDQL